jgi:hypothetical protein
MVLAWFPQVSLPEGKGFQLVALLAADCPKLARCISAVLARLEAAGTNLACNTEDKVVPPEPLP